MQKNLYVKKSHLGIITDESPESVPGTHWTSCQNIQFTNKATKSADGVDAFIDTLEPAFFTMPVDVAGVVYWIYCTNDNVYVFDGVVSIDITPTGGLLPVSVGSWVGTTLNNIPVLTNGVNAPFYWDLNPANPCETLPGWPVDAKCKSIRAYKYHLFALNITDGTTNYDDTLWWSDSAEPGTVPQEWTPSPTNDAGDFSLSDTMGAIFDALPLQDSLIVYKENATYTINYVAGQYVFAQRKNFLTSGVHSVNSVIEVMGNHYLFTGSDVVRFDGQTAQSIVEDKVKLELIRLVDGERSNQACMVNNQAANLIWVCIPISGADGLSRAYVINVLTGDVGIRDLENINFATSGAVTPVPLNLTWDTDTYEWDLKPLFWGQGVNASKLYVPVICPNSNVIQEAQLNDSPVKYYVERQSLEVQEGNTLDRLMVNQVIPRMQGVLGEVVNINLGSQDYSGSPVKWAGVQPFTIGQDAFVNFQVEGRLFSISFAGETTHGISIDSYGLSYTEEGLY